MPGEAPGPTSRKATTVLVVVTPGQGSQTPGFLTPWLELPGVRERLDWLSAVAGMDLVEHGTQSDADTIRDTAVAHRLIAYDGALDAVYALLQFVEAIRCHLWEVKVEPPF